MPISTQNMIFVFGSNLGGIHGAGAARYAHQHRGAQMGIGVGRTGQSYAIPTKGIRETRVHTSSRTSTVGDTLPMETIKHYVNMFLAYAETHPHYFFKVTCIGCGLAGLKDEDIAPMFMGAPFNCYFDTKWQKYLTSDAKFWGTF